MKYCVDCKWFKAASYDDPAKALEFARCTNRRCAFPWDYQPDGNSYVAPRLPDGDFLRPFCSVLRKYKVNLFDRVTGTGYRCGHDARFFEAKQP